MFVSLLGVTILLSLTVFLLLVAETMPPTSDAVPLIGSFNRHTLTFRLYLLDNRFSVFYTTRLPSSQSSIFTQTSFKTHLLFFLDEHVL